MESYAHADNGNMQTSQGNLVAKKRIKVEKEAPAYHYDTDDDIKFPRSASPTQSDALSSAVSVTPLPVQSLPTIPGEREKAEKEKGASYLNTGVKIKEEEVDYDTDGATSFLMGKEDCAKKSHDDTAEDNDDATTRGGVGSRYLH